MPVQIKFAVISSFKPVWMKLCQSKLADLLFSASLNKVIPIGLRIKLYFNQVTCRLTLSLPHFWQNCSPSATFILTISDMLPYVAQNLPKSLIFLPFIFNNLSEKSKIWTIEIKNILGTTEYLKKRTICRMKGRVSKLPIRDVGSERVNQCKSHSNTSFYVIFNKCFIRFHLKIILYQYSHE